MPRSSETSNSSATSSSRRPPRSTRDGRPSEGEAHLDQVPQLTAFAAHVPPAASLFHEAELPVERDRGLVVRKHAERELVQATRPRPVDRRRDQCGPDSATALVARDEHPELTEPEAALVDEEEA